jgi:hypothetical protein
MWSFGRWLRSRDGYMGNGTCNGPFRKISFFVTGESVRAKAGFETVNVAADEKRLPIF